LEIANPSSESGENKTTEQISFSKTEQKRFWKAQYQLQYYWNHREKALARVSRYSKRQRILKQYGISEKLYNSILGNQLGVCAICCETNSNGQTLSIDHDHKTGEIRGLLCIKCNSAVGILERVGFAGFEAYLEIA